MQGNVKRSSFDCNSIVYLHIHIYSYCSEAQNTMIHANLRKGFEVFLIPGPAT